VSITLDSDLDFYLLMRGAGLSQWSAAAAVGADRATAMH